MKVAHAREEVLWVQVSLMGYGGEDGEDGEYGELAAKIAEQERAREQAALEQAQQAQAQRAQQQTSNGGHEELEFTDE